MHLTTKNLTQASLAGMGWLLSNERQSPRDLVEEFSYRDVVRDLELDAPLSSGLLECKPRELSLVRMEQHQHTREMLIALEGEAIICLAPPQKIESGPLDGVVALRMLAGQSIILEIGAWHWIPFPTTGQAALFQVIFRCGTGDDDLILYDLPYPISIDSPVVENRIDDLSTVTE